MEKINIAELLKNCPKGMELDCVMFNKVTLVEVDFDNCDYPISISVSGDRHSLSRYGEWFYEDKNAKCVIFPKGKTTWEGFIPPKWFKDGDIVSDNAFTSSTCIGIFKQKEEPNLFELYCRLSSSGEFYSTNSKHRFEDIHLASEEEKAKLFDAIKENGYKWNEETKTLEKLNIPKEETIEEPKELLIGFTKDKDGNKVLNTHEDYEIKEVGGKFMLLKKKPQYPNTFEECCDVLGYNKNLVLGTMPRKYEKLIKLQKLLICRDAYWQIAEEWEPDWTNSSQRKYCIVITLGKIEKWVQKTTNKILAFPTEEMRDSFLENFKTDIENCKEFL